MSYQHATVSKEVRKFLNNCGIVINKADSAHNVICLQNKSTGEKIKLWAESEYSVAGGVPGIFYDTL